MRFRLVGPVLLVCSIILSYEIGSHMHRSSNPAKAPTKLETTKTEPAQTDEYMGQVKVVGPLANWMSDAETGSDVVTPEEPAAPHYQASGRDRVIRRPTPAPQNFVHTTFAVKKYMAFEILIPPGTVSAYLTGNFESFTKPAGERQPADVELLLLDEPGFNDFIHGSGGSPIYNVEPSPAHSLKWLLNSDYQRVKKYYFVFNNPARRLEVPSVKANFTVQFN